MPFTEQPHLAATTVVPFAIPAAWRFAIYLVAGVSSAGLALAVSLGWITAVEGVAWGSFVGTVSGLLAASNVTKAVAPVVEDEAAEG
jgi:hypothetical protein